MSIDYAQLKTMVKEAMFTGGGINEPSAPEGVPHRTGAQSNADKEQNMGDPKANELYDVALTAREATEKLVVALDDPVYDGAYENAFKATTALRKVLNDIEMAGAHPMPDQRVVAPPKSMQKYAGSTSYAGYSAGAWGGGDGAGGMQEAKMELSSLQGGVKRAVEMYTRMNEKDKQAFQAFILGDATGDK